MLSEVLLLLSGHPSSIFIPAPSTSSVASSPSADIPPLTVSPSFRPYLHPGEVDVLEKIASIASRYARVKRFAEDSRRDAIAASLDFGSRQRTRPTAAGKGKAADVGHRPGDLAQEGSQHAPPPRRRARVPFLYLAALSHRLLVLLSGYESLLLDFERRVLSRDPSIVGGPHTVGGGQDDDDAGAPRAADANRVSLASVLAAISPWDAPLTALSDLVSDLERGPELDSSTTTTPTSQMASPGASDRAEQSRRDWAPGELIDTLLARSQAGVLTVSEMMGELAQAAQDTWMARLVAWICHGEASTTSSSLVVPVSSAAAKRLPVPSSPSTTTTEPQYVFAHSALPSCISAQTASSILSVGRTIATVKARAPLVAHPSSSAKSRVLVPEEMTAAHTKLLRGSRGVSTGHTSRLPSSVECRTDGVLPQQTTEFAEAIEVIRAEVSEWLWRTVLTKSAVVEALRALGDFVLLRNGQYAVSLHHHLERLKLTKLSAIRSTAVIREQDLNLLLLQASVGTSAEEDAALERLSFHLPQGDFHPFLADVRTRAFQTGGARGDRSLRGAAAVRLKGLFPEGQRFDALPLGAPLHLHFAAPFPLDLFLTPSALAAYSRFFSYLFAIRRTHSRVLELWLSLSSKQRNRRKWTGLGEGGTEEEKERTGLLRKAWGLVRSMLGLLDTLWGHFQTDVIDVQLNKLLEQIDPPQTARRRQRSEERDGVDSSRVPSPGGTVTAAASASVVGTSRLRFPSMSTPSRTTSVHSTRIFSAMTAAPRQSTDALTIGPRSSIYPGTPRSQPSAVATRWADESGRVDFSTLKQMHASYLSFLQDGLLLSSPAASAVLFDFLSACDQFIGIVERWGGDVLPDLLEEGSLRVGDDEEETIEEEVQGLGTVRRRKDFGVGKLVRERGAVVAEYSERIDGLIDSLFDLLSAASSEPAGGADASRSMTGGISSLAMASGARQLYTLPLGASRSGAFGGSGGASGLPSSRQANHEHDGAFEARLEANSAAHRHLEQLLLRLDFNAWHSTRAEREERAAEMEKLRGLKMLDGL